MTYLLLKLSDEEASCLEFALAKLVNPSAVVPEPIKPSEIDSTKEKKIVLLTNILTKLQSKDPSL